jgi:hypothetical protein
MVLCSSQVRARSEDDAEEELLCVAVLKGGRKVAAGASDGVLNIFSWGYWNDCSDRYPGKPAAVFVLVAALLGCCCIANQWLLGVGVSTLDKCREECSSSLT